MMDVAHTCRSNRVRAAIVRLFGRPCRQHYLLWTLALALWLGLLLGLLVVVPGVPRLIFAENRSELLDVDPEANFLTPIEGAKPDRFVPSRIKMLETDRPIARTLLASRRQDAPLDISPDGSLLLVREESRELAIWETATGRKVGHLDRLANAVEPLEVWGFSPDGRFVFLVRCPLTDLTPNDWRASLCLWDVNAKKIHKKFGNDVLPPTFSPDGKRFACCHLNNRRQIVKVELWSMDDDFPASGPIKVHDVLADEIAFSPTFDSFATVYRSGREEESATIELWDVVSGAKKGELPIVGGLWYFQLHGDAGTRFETWNTRPGNVVWDTPPSSSENRYQFYPDPSPYSNDHRWFLIDPNSREPEACDIAPFQKRCKLLRAGDIPTISAPTCQFGPDNKTILVTGLTAPNPGNPVTNFLGQFVTGFKPSGSRQVARLWDLETATELATFENCTKAYYSPDGKTLLTIHEDGTLNLWDVPPRKPFLQIALTACVLWLIVIFGLQLWGRLVRGRSSTGPQHPVQPADDGLNRLAIDTH